MCGIFGEFTFSEKLNVLESLKKTELLAHRGPDGYGAAIGDYGNGYQLFLNKPIETSNHFYDYFLGHRRLSIIDLDETSSQPMESLCRRYLVIFNGEIYNFIELKKELLDLGFSFKTDHSDTEVLLNSFIAWGEKCLDKFIGMFAFAIYDHKENKIFMARDRIGQKPLYYWLSNKKFTFASELTSIIKTSNNRFEINDNTLDRYLTYGYVPDPDSLFKEIKKLPPACFAWVHLDNGRLRIQNYWDLALEDNNVLTKDEWLEKVNWLIRDAVRLRLRSDVPLGAFTSGGIDSTLVLKQMSRLTSTSIVTFGADFLQKRFSEKTYIEAVAKKFGTHLNLELIDTSFAENYDQILSVFDEPFDGGSSIASFILFKIAKENDIKVILTGDGGDELFSGYKRYQDVLIQKKIKNIVQRIGCPRLFARILAGVQINPQKASHLINEMDIKEEIEGYFEYHNRDNLASLMHTRIAPSNYYRNLLPEVIADFIKVIQYLDLKSILPGRMLYKMDRLSMYHSIEARSPFMDHRICELAFSIPVKYKINSVDKKIILKALLKNDFSRSFLKRPKTGFGNPLSEWFVKVENKNILLKNLRDKNDILFDYIDHQALCAMYPQILDHDLAIKNVQALWRLIVLSNYLNKYQSYLK